MLLSESLDLGLIVFFHSKAFWKLVKPAERLDTFLFYCLLLFLSGRSSFS